MKCLWNKKNIFFPSAIVKHGHIVIPFEAVIIQCK